MKRSYHRPAVGKVRLAVEDAVLGGCKWCHVPSPGPGTWLGSCLFNTGEQCNLLTST
jgi:hypothetical protein